MTGAIKKSFDHWYDTKELSDIEFINLVRSLDVDILIDLAGYTLGNRIQALRARCAPMQVSWLGYCNTLGSDSIDYIVADRNLIKKEEEDQYVEKILYLPNIWNAMSKPKNLPSINELPAKDNSIFTLGSFNNFSKISSETIKVWAEILNNSNSRLILKSGSVEGDGSKENIIKKFKKYVHKENKILLLDRSQTMQEHLSEYNKIDLALDTFPFPGVTTTFEALLMGVPVLTMKGFNFNSRCGESINLNLKMNEFLADTAKDYVNKAIAVQGNLNKLVSLRSSLREITLESSLFDTETFAKELSNILKETWNKTI
jgi:predicted O-linked N-acetylglucosamine transferase (SPINDLY family)